MTDKQYDFELSEKDMRKLLSEISRMPDFDEDIQPVTMQEVEAIEASYQAAEAELLEKYFTCKHCGSPKAHYRKWGYRCPNRCEDEQP